jgi:hypothetical protein
MSKRVHCLSIQIADLLYLENVPEDELILGSAGLSVTSEAFAFGSESYPFASASSTATSRSDDDFASIGTGLAEAFGEDSTASITVISGGDTVIEKTKSQTFENTGFGGGFITALKFPSKLNFQNLWKDLY